jgi:hypothetical protein
MCDEARQLSQVGGGELTTSSEYEVAGQPHHELKAGWHSYVGAWNWTDQTHQISCASLWSSGQDAHAFESNKNQFETLIIFLFCYITNLYINFLSVTFCHLKAAHSSIVVLTQG